MADLRIQWAYVPFLLAAIVIQLAAPRRLFGRWWPAIVLAGAALIGAAILIRRALADDGRRRLLLFAPPLAFPMLAGCLDSVWPLAMLLPALIFVVRWRAVRIQTGHEPPPSP
jgi:hypothetical protein